MKQQNLFGQPVVEDLNKAIGAKGKKKAVGKEKTKGDRKKSPLPDGFVAEPEPVRDAQMDDDSRPTSNFDSQVQEVETQLEETQLNESSPPDTEVDTQPGTETQTEEEQTQLETQVDEDDGEPVGLFIRNPSDSLAESWKLFSIRLLIGRLRRHEERRWNRSHTRSLEAALLCIFWGPVLYHHVRTIMIMWV